jgi:hypothetical protein
LPDWRTTKSPLSTRKDFGVVCIRVITNACADCSFGWTCDLRSPPEGHIIFLLTFYPKEVIGQPGDGSRVPSNDVVLGYFLVLPHRIMYLPFTRSMFSPTVSIGSGSVCIIPLYSVFPPPLFFPLLIFACSSPFLVCLQPHSLFPFETLCFLGGSVQGVHFHFSLALSLSLTLYVEVTSLTTSSLRVGCGGMGG